MPLTENQRRTTQRQPSEAAAGKEYANPAATSAAPTAAATMTTPDRVFRRGRSQRRGRGRSQRRGHSQRRGRN